MYSDLRNVFDLAMIAGVIHEQGLDKAVDWQANFFGDATSPNENFKTEVWPTPREVDTVMNYKEMVRRKGNSKIKDIFIGVSGGVRADVGQELSSAEVKVDDYQEISAQATGGKPASWQSNEWWWDR